MLNKKIERRNRVKNAILKVVIILALITVCCSCGIKSVKEWAANKLVVEVQDSMGKAIFHALVETSENQQIETDEDGKAMLYYQKSGLKVITIGAEKFETKQIKVNMPKDNNKVVNVILIGKN